MVGKKQQAPTCFDSDGAIFVLRQIQPDFFMSSGKDKKPDAEKVARLYFNRKFKAQFGMNSVLQWLRSKSRTV
jgi:hypothetical protein